jgi:hypothetical protein
MKRAVLLVLGLAVGMACVPAAPAQNPGGGLLITRVCGSNGCKSIFNGLFIVRPHGAALETTGAPPLGPFFVLEPSNYTAEEQIEESLGPTTPAFFVPREGLVRARPDAGQLARQAWIRLSARRKADLREALRGLEPYHARPLTEVVIAGHEAGDPQSYRAVYDDFEQVPEPDPFGRGDPVSVVLRSDERSPWTDGHNRIAYYPALGLLSRDGEWVRPSADLVDRIKDPAAPGGGGIPWPRIGGCGPGAVAPDRQATAAEARGDGAASVGLDELDRSAVDLDEPDAHLAEDVERLGCDSVAPHRLLERIDAVSDVGHGAHELGLRAPVLVPEPFDAERMVGRAREPEALRLEVAHPVALRGRRDADVVELHGASAPSRNAAELRGREHQALQGRRERSNEGSYGRDRGRRSAQCDGRHEAGLHCWEGH